MVCSFNNKPYTPVLHRKYIIIIIITPHFHKQIITIFIIQISWISHSICYSPGFQDWHIKSMFVEYAHVSLGHQDCSKYYVKSMIFEL